MLSSHDTTSYENDLVRNWLGRGGNPVRTNVGISPSHQTQASPSQPVDSLTYKRSITCRNVGDETEPPHPSQRSQGGLEGSAEVPKFLRDNALLTAPAV